MMLEFLGWKPEAIALRDAVRAALKENYATPDLGGEKQTHDVGDWLAARAAKTASKPYLK